MQKVPDTVILRSSKVKGQGHDLNIHTSHVLT